MSKFRRARVLLALLASFALLAAACGGSDDTGSESGSESSSESASESSGDDATVGDLAQCPNPIVIQTDWFPEPEHGAAYNLTGGAGSIDAESGRFTGPLAADPSIDVEIRAGGPFVGFQTTVALMYQDDDIFLGYVNTDEAVANYADFPTMAVMAPLEINPQILMWDPETYDFKTFQDIGESGAIVNHFAGATYTEFLTGSGMLNEDQLDGSYDGAPTRFINEGGALVQQGFATQEPWNYENIFGDWGKPVDFLLIHDSGFEIYQGPFALRDDKLDAAADACLTALVPLLQQSAVDFAKDPTATNAAIRQAVVDLDSFWELSDEGVIATVKAMNDLGIVSNGPNGTAGDFNMDRVNSTIKIMADQVPSISVPDGLTADDITTNKYIDPSIGY